MPAASYNELFGLGSHSPDASLELWYRLADNAANTTIVDDSGHSRNGTTSPMNTSAFTTGGPNSWLTAGLLFSHTVPNTVSTPYAGTPTDFSCLVRFKNNSANSYARIVDKAYDTGFWLGHETGTNYGGGVRESGAPYGRFGSLADGSWHNLASIRSGTTHTIYGDGASLASGTVSGTALDGSTLYIARSVGGSDALSAYLADVAFFSRALTSGEETHWELGPEPVNTVAPAMTGTETQGQTLSCTTGTWGLDSPFSGGSNGTVTYARQWTRSNTAGGSGEADIGGETGSTYVLAAGDVTKYIRCRVRATNDGGYDSAADTVSNMSGAIAGSSATYTAAAALAAGPATLAASATFSPGTHTAAATLAAGKATLAASATFSAGTHTAAAALVAGKSTLAGSATFSAGTKTASAALAAGPAALVATAAFSSGVKTAAAALAAGPSALAATATFSPGTKTAAVTLAAGKSTLAANATFSPGTHTAVVTLSAGRATLAASATFSPGTHTAAVALAAGPTTLAAAVTFSPGAHTAAAALVAGKSTLAASVSFALAQRTAAASLAAGPSTLVALATFTPSGLVRRYRNRHYRYVFAFGRRIR